MIRTGGKTLKFYVRNLLMEIVTIDRDADPLRFDEELKDFDYFLAKMGRAVNSKLRVVFEVLKEDDLDAAVENICLNENKDAIS